MTGEQWRDERMLEWLESGPSDVPTEPLEAAIAYARTHPRRRLSGTGLRRMIMSQVHLTEVKPPTTHRNWTAVLAAAVVVVVVVAGGAALISRNNNQPSGVAAPGAATPVQPSPRSTVAPTQAPSPSRSAFVGDPSCTVATVAGKAGEAGAVDGGFTDARFSEESGPQFFWDDVFIPDGLLFLTDAGNNTIRVMARDNATVTTVAGKAGEPGYVDGPCDAARFDYPTDVVGGPNVGAPGGALYVADSDNHVIRKITFDGGCGTVSTLAGKAGEAGHKDGVGADARFSRPWTLEVDDTGNVYVGEVDGYTIRKITPDGTVTTLVGKAGEFRYGVDGPASEAGFGWPFAIGFDAQGVMHVTDLDKELQRSQLRTVAADGTVTTVNADWRPVGQPGPFWYDPSGTVYVTSPLANTVSKLTPDGTVTVVAGIPYMSGTADGTGDVARFDTPMSIVADRWGTLYVGDSGNATIRTITCAVGGGFPTGRWSRPLPSGMTGVVDFRPDGTWTYTRDGEVMSTGAYSTDAGTLTFVSDSGCSEQNAERGTYAWTYANDRLMFTRLDDQCLVGRVTTFDGSTWTPAE